MTIYKYFDLPKVSLNDWYRGAHWSKRKKIKDAYIWLIRDKKIDYPCRCEYRFVFKTKPLDCSNCVAMVKLVEDCLFVDDGIKIVKEINIISEKGLRDELTVMIAPE